MKSYNNGIEGADFMDQRFDRLHVNYRLKCIFNRQILFDLTDVALIRSHIVCQQLNSSFNLLNFEIAIVNFLIEKCNSYQRAFIQSKSN